MIIGSAAVSGLHSVGALSPKPKLISKIGRGIYFSIFASAGNTIAGTSSVNLMVGGLTNSVTGLDIGSEKHYNDSFAKGVAKDIESAYYYFKGLTPNGSIYLNGTFLPTSPNFSGDMAGYTLYPGVYYSAGAATNSINVTFDALGDPDAEFVININGAFAPAAAANIILLNGAKASNIFWQVVGAIATGASSHMKGNLLSPSAIGFGDSASLEGRVLAFEVGTSTLSSNVITTTL